MNIFQASTCDTSNSHFVTAKAMNLS